LKKKENMPYFLLQSKSAIDFFLYNDYVGTIGCSNMRLMNDDINETDRKENLKWQ